MASNRKILIGVDSTVHSANALKWALDNFPLDRKNELHLVHVENSDQDGKNMQEKRSFMAEMENFIRERHPKATEGDRYFVKRVQGKSPVKALIDYGKETQCKIVVVGERYSLDAFGTRWGDVPIGLIRDFPGIIVIVRDTSLFAKARPLVEIYGAQTLFKDQRLAFDMKEGKESMEHENVSEESVLSPESSGEEELAAAMGHPLKKRPEMPLEDEETKGKLPTEDKIPEKKGKKEFKEPHERLEGIPTPKEKDLPIEKAKISGKPSKIEPEKRELEKIPPEGESGPLSAEEVPKIMKPQEKMRGEPDERRDKGLKPDEGREKGLKPEERKPEDLKVGERRPEDLKPDEGRDKGLKPDERRPEDLKPEERKPEGLKPDERKPEDLKVCERRPEDLKPDERRPEEKERLAEGKPLERGKEPREFKPLEREEKPEDFKHLKELPEDKKIAEIPSSRKEEEKERPELVYPIGKEPTKEFPSFEGEPRKIPEGAIRPQKGEQRKPEAFPDRIPPEPKAAREGEIPTREGIDKYEGPLEKEIPEHARLPEKEFPEAKKFGEKGAAPLGYGEKIPDEAAQKGKAAPSEKEPTSIPQKPDHELPLKKEISDEAKKPIAEEIPIEEEVSEEESKKPKWYMLGLDKLADVLDENIPSLPGLPKTEGEGGEEELPPTKPAREAAKEPGAKEPERKEAFPPLSEALERKKDKFPPEKEEKRPSEERFQEKPGEIPKESKTLGKKPEETLRRDKEPQQAPSLQEQVAKIPEKIKDITKAFDEIPDKLQDIPEKTKKISNDLEDISERAKANAKLLDDEYNRHDEPPEELKEARKLSQEIPKQLDQISDNLREIPAATEKINKQLGNMQEKLDELPKNMKEVADNLKAIPRKEKEVPEAIPKKEFERPEEPSQTLSMAEQLEKIPREKDGTPSEVPSKLKEIPKEFKVPKEVEKVPTQPEFHEKEREPEKEKFKESPIEPKEIPTTKAPEEVETVPRGVGGEFAKVPVEPVFAAKEKPLSKKEEAFREKPLESGKLPLKLPREAEDEIPSVKEKPESIEAKESMLPKFKAPSKEFRVESPTPPVEEGKMEPESRIPKPSFAEVPPFKREPEMAAEISRVGPEGESKIPSVPLEGERQFPTEAAEKVGKTSFDGGRKESGVPKKVEEIIKEKPLGFVEEKIPPAPVPRMASPMPSGYGMAEGKLAPETKPKLFKEEEITMPYPKVQEEIDLGKDIGISFPVEPTYESLPTIQEKKIPPTEMEAPGLVKEKAIFPKEESRIEPFKEIPSVKGREIPSVERQATEGLPKGAELGHRPIEKEEFFPKEREEMIPSDKEKITPSAVRDAENLKEQRKVPPSWEDRKLTPEAIQEAEDIKAKYETLREAPSVIPKVEHELGTGIPVAEKLEQKEKMVPLVRPEEARRPEPAIEKPVHGKIPAEEGRKHEEPYPPFEKSKQKEEIPVEKTSYEGDKRVEYPKEMKQPIAPHPQEKERPIQPEKEGVSPQSITEIFLPAEKEEGYPPRPSEKEGYPPRPSEKEGYPSGPAPGEGFTARPVGKEGYPPHPVPEAGYPVRQTEKKAKPYYQPIEPYPSMEEESRKLEKDTGIVFPEMPKFKPIESILPKSVEQAPKAGTKFGSNSSTEFVPTKPETYPVTDEKHYEPSAAERIPDASGAGKGPTIASIIRQYKEEPTLKEDLDETYKRTMPKRESPHPIEAVQKQGPPTEHAGAHEPRPVPSKEPAIEERHTPATERVMPPKEPAIEERHAPATERVMPPKEPAIEERHGPAKEAPKEKKKGFWQNIVESIPLMGEDSDDESAKTHKLPSEKTHAQPSERTHEPSAEEEPSHEDDESKGKKTFFENLLKKKSAFTKIPSTHGDGAETAEGHDETKDGESQVQPDEYDVTQKSFMTFKGAQRKK